MNKFAIPVRIGNCSKSLGEAIVVLKACNNIGQYRENRCSVKPILNSAIGFPCVKGWFSVLLPKFKSISTVLNWQSVIAATENNPESREIHCFSSS